MTHFLLLVLDLLGTFVFALSGALTGVRRQLDLFGVLVLSFVAANSGGIVRDVLIGATPPAAIRDWRYLAASLLAGVLIFFWYPSIKRLRSPVLIFDAAGLALFCVAGAQKALVFGLSPVAAVGDQFLRWQARRRRSARPARRCRSSTCAMC